MKHFLIVLTNALPLLCAAALMIGGAALAAHDSPRSRAAEVRRLHEQVATLNARLRTLETPSR